MYEVMHMIGRLELQNDIAYFKLNNDSVSFPVDHKRTSKTKIYDLPSESDINSTIEKAKEKAIEDALSLGMSPANYDNFVFQSNEDIDETDDIDILENVDVNDTAEECQENIEEGAYTTVIDENGDEVTIRKSTLVWMLSEPSIAISKDRLRRVQVTNARV